ncbi:glycosyltransferase [Comamonas thiooxydans]|uniref:glycosyltransferase n=1 Tax=Comamonas thiooxydans TaxID=363952 RepID=UPI001CCC0AB0|nr:glycosyltransferase [Comamonas thiooxydans]UBQ40023.1 putative rhamnosyl transferase [Comamonas thiooxydans]
MKKINPCVGLMRFSTISSRDKGAFISSREKSWDEHIASILDPRRLEFRINFLSKITLPQIDNQTLRADPSWFSFIVIISELLPENFKKILYSEKEKYPWLKVVERGVDDWVGAELLIKESLLSMDYTDEVPFLSFRLDDDDSISVKFLEKSQFYINGDNVDKFLTFSRGAKILWAKNDFSIKNYQKEHRPFIAIGLGAISNFNYQTGDFSSKIRTVFIGLNHYEIKENNSFIDDESEDMFIWSHHASQDTFGRFKSVEFKGEWVEPPDSIFSDLSDFPYLKNYVK